MKKDWIMKNTRIECVNAMASRWLARLIWETCIYIGIKFHKQIVIFFNNIYSWIDWSWCNLVLKSGLYFILVNIWFSGVAILLLSCKIYTSICKQNQAVPSELLNFQAWVFKFHLELGRICWVGTFQTRFKFSRVLY